MRIKTNSLQPNFNAIYEQQRQTSSTEREILCIKRVNYRQHYEYFSFRYESILQVIEGVTTTITTNDKDIEFKMRLGWLTEIIVV
jgi:hypothetical protein